MNHDDFPSRTVPPGRTRALVPRQSQSQSLAGAGVNIPSSAVIGIGLGFVAFAFSILGLLLTIRVLRVRRRVRQAQRNGRPEMTFASLWDEEGGFFGFLTGQGDGLAAIGAGAVADVTRIRRMLENYKRWEEVLAREPEMYEVEVAPRGTFPGTDHEAPKKVEMGGAEPEVWLESVIPLAMQSSAHPPITARPRPPHEQSSPDFYLQVLITLPADPSSIHSKHQGPEAEGDFDDLPELVIGSTTLLPMLYPRSTPTHAIALGSEVGDRRIRWQIAEGGKWTFEGMEGG